MSDVFGALLVLIEEGGQVEFKRVQFLKFVFGRLVGSPYFNNGQLFPPVMIFEVQVKLALLLMRLGGWDRRLPLLLVLEDHLALVDARLLLVASPLDDEFGPEARPRLLLSKCSHHFVGLNVERKRMTSLICGLFVLLESR